MSKGILKVTKSSKGKILVAIDRLNGKPPMGLSYVTNFTDLKLNEKECEYIMDGIGRITQISVDGVTVYGKQEVIQQHPKNNDNPNTPKTKQIGHPTQNFNDSFNASETKLPKRVRELLQGQNIDNFALKYQKAGRCIFFGQKEKFFFFKNDKRSYKDGRPDTGDQFFIKHNNYGGINFQGIAQRQKNQVESLFPDNNELLSLSPDWRLICGLSGGIYETNMTLHHVYGVPFIPSSSIKGVLRSWMIQNIWGNTQESEADAFNESQLMCDIFGCPEKIEYEKKIEEHKINRSSKQSFYAKYEAQFKIKEKQGDVIFFDALPTNTPNLMPDIMNVHYPNWYDKGEAPTDFQSPNPIPFLTVAEGSQFQTFVASKMNVKLSNWQGEKCKELISKANLTENHTLLSLVKTWLNKSLSEHGIGAKTSVGYGYFKQP